MDSSPKKPISMSASHWSMRCVLCQRRALWWPGRTLAAVAARAEIVLRQHDWRALCSGATADCRWARSRASSWQRAGTESEIATNANRPAVSARVVQALQVPSHLSAPEDNASRDLFPLTVPILSDATRCRKSARRLVDAYLPNIFAPDHKDFELQRHSFDIKGRAANRYFGLGTNSTGWMRAQFDAASI